MVKNILLITLCSSTILSAMQEPTETEQNQKNWFLYLPNEVCNLIASYLTFDDFETEEEFIERTKTLPIEAKNHYQLLQPGSFYLPDMNKTKSSQGTICSLCPNSTQAIFLELFDSHNKLNIIDLKSKQIIIQKKLRTENYSNGLAVFTSDYKGIALSRNTDLFAMLKRKDHVVGKYYDAQIVIRKVNQPITDRTEETIPFARMVKFEEEYPLIAFNKQSTHIIMHEKKDKHIIYPISTVNSKETPANKTLKHYLFLNNVFIKDWNCKKIVVGS